MTSGEVFQRGNKKEEKSGKRGKNREKGRKRENKVRNMLQREEKWKKGDFSYGFSSLKNFPELCAYLSGEVF